MVAMDRAVYRVMYRRVAVKINTKFQFPKRCSRTAPPRQCLQLFKVKIPSFPYRYGMPHIDCLIYTEVRTAL